MSIGVFLQGVLSLVYPMTLVSPITLISLFGLVISRGAASSPLRLGMASLAPYY